jgi:hypothetical protein
MEPQNNVYIYNTRTGGQNSNWLGAVYTSDGIFTPTLAVKGEGLISSIWNIVQDAPGLPFCLEIKDKASNPYRLVTPVNPASGSLCSFQAVSNLNPNSGFRYWCFSYPTRILLAWNICDPNQQRLSLDAGKYPQPMVFDFVSSVNQTWQYSSTPPSS